MKSLPKPTARKIDKFVAIMQALHSGKNTYFSITCLTSIKGLCQEPETAARFVAHLAEKTQDKVNLGDFPQSVEPEKWEHYKVLINEAMSYIKAHMESATPESLSALRVMLPKLRGIQQFTGKQYWGHPLISINSTDVLILENAVECILSPWAAPRIAYETARNYCECYDPRYGTGLIPESAPLLEDVIRFWYDT
jgi:hypothetical protein